MEDKPASLTHKLNLTENFGKILGLTLIVALIVGVGTGFLFAKTAGKRSAASPLSGKPTTPQQDKSTFRDTEEGTIQKRDNEESNEYTEGTHYLIREGHPPVALTSSVVDLSLYEGKKVRVYGETLGALREGWLMDVGLVEE